MYEQHRVRRGCMRPWQEPSSYVRTRRPVHSVHATVVVAAMMMVPGVVWPVATTTTPTTKEIKKWARAYLPDNVRNKIENMKYLNTNRIATSRPKPQNDEHTTKDVQIECEQKKTEKKDREKVRRFVIIWNLFHVWLVCHAPATHPVCAPIRFAVNSFSVSQETKSAEIIESSPSNWVRSSTM